MSKSWHRFRRLPRDQTDAQRGSGVFEASIAALRRFNELGYGVEGSGLLLHLVTNPVGRVPPGLAGRARGRLEARIAAAPRRDVQPALHDHEHADQPVPAVSDRLGQPAGLHGAADDAFNPAAVDGLMCRNTMSVGWDGTLYDCDFNQMLDLAPRTRRRARFSMRRPPPCRPSDRRRPALLRLHRRGWLELRRFLGASLLWGEGGMMPHTNTWSRARR